MSVASRPDRSTEGITSDSAGLYPPGKMYLSIQAFVAPGPSLTLRSNQSRSSTRSQLHSTDTGASSRGATACTGQQTA